MALLEGDEDPSGGRRYALVKARGGTVLADGDEAFEDRAAAIAAFERARPLGWSPFAMPGRRPRRSRKAAPPGGDARAGDARATDLPIDSSAMDARFRRLCAVFADGRCLIAEGYEPDADGLALGVAGGGALRGRLRLRPAARPRFCRSRAHQTMNGCLASTRILRVAASSLGRSV